LTVKTREWERAIEELEERYVRSQDENEDLRRKAQNLDRSLSELRQYAGDHDKREQRQVEQYERVIEGLRADLREKERELSNVELRETFAKQDLAQSLR
jgi:predicted RNase H-like nuclease (RuvC/YqgF family)